MRIHLLLIGAAVLPYLFAEERTAPLGEFTAAQRQYWAFVKRSQPEIPRFTAAADRHWVQNPVDAFILARLKKEGLRPAPPADRSTLIRRLYFDLVGLPPTPSETAKFVADTSPDAYPKLVDRLLASAHYGERWGQHWLDVVRFAETDGFEYDTHRRDAWRYRDYVIGSFNNDKPYNRFILEQLAGDEIGPDQEETLVAAGFNRLGPLRRNAGNQEVASSRNEVLTEMTNVVGSAILGVTLGCARCHDHMFDPIKQSDYYRIQAYFSATYEKDVPKASAEEQSAWKAKAEPIEQEIKSLRAALTAVEGEQRQAMQKKIDAAQERMPEPLPALFSVSNDAQKRSPIHLLARGEYEKKGDRVGMRPLGVLLPDSIPEQPAGAPNPRTSLGQWVVDPENPLTARVMVNRTWLYHFGRGIVATPNDFGRRGGRPSHPELLDYLANQFVAGGFRLKPVHRLILLSRTYQQSSDPVNVEANTKDPENTLLWKFSRRRLDAEEIRDAMLAVSGTLNPRMGGPSVIVPVDKELVSALYKPAQWAVTPDPKEHARRSIYLIAKRNLRVPFMEVFDAPDGLVSCPRRESSTHAGQALELLNGEFANQQAEFLARRLELDAGAGGRGQVDLAYRLVAGRPPNAKEMQVALGFLKSQPVREFALAMLNLNAFLYVN